MDGQSLPRLVDSDINVDFIWPTIKKAGYEADEDGLLKVIRDNKSKKLVHYAVIALSKLGTAKSIPALKELLYYSDDDVMTTAVTTIGSIAGPKETKLYAALLDDPKYKDKGYPMAVIWEVGNEDALPSVIRYVENMLRGKAKPYTFHLDYQYPIQYLSKYSSKEVDDLIEKFEKLAAKYPAPKLMSKEALEKFKKEHQNV